MRRRGLVPFSEPYVWYPALGLLALEELVELPVVTAVVVGRLLLERPRGRSRGERGPVGPTGA